MKRVLIFTVTAGNGHNSIANAIKEECEKQGAKVKLVDLLHEYCDNKLFIWIQEGGYGLALTYFNSLYNAYFRYFQNVDPKKFYDSPVQPGLKKMHAKMLKAINEFKPDAIFCSHFMPCIMLTNLKRCYPVPAKVFTVLTDYVVCPFWECGTDIYKMTIPNESFIDKLVQKGFKKEQLVPYGLTVKEKFSEVLKKEDARNQLGLKNDVFTIFVMFGGGFWSGNLEIVKTLFTIKNIPLQIIVANGKNKHEKARIDKLKVPKNITLINYGFANNVDIIMSASDVLVGKAGGISITEALNKKIPMICCKKLPQQEYENVAMLLKAGAAKQYKNKKQLVEYIKEMAQDPESMKMLVENIEKIRRPHATQKIVRDMLECEADYQDKDTIDYSKVDLNVRKALRNCKKLYYEEKKENKQTKEKSAKNK